MSKSNTQDGLDPTRWRTLFVVAISQLMVVLDSSIVNIAIPTAKVDLHISDANQQWVITAYTLAFGSLLLLGGRIGDFMGRKRILIVGLLGFAGASALGGLAQTQHLLFAARALQGVFGALLAPAALAIISVTFSDPKERSKAFGVMGAISGGGAAIGEQRQSGAGDRAVDSVGAVVCPGRGGGADRRARAAAAVEDDRALRVDRPSLSREL